MTTVQNGRRVEEDVVDFGNGVRLPVATVLDRTGPISALRVYHSFWPLAQKHIVRPPLLQEDPGLVVEGIVGAYQRALAAGALEEIVATFESDGVAREPAAGDYCHRGRDGFRGFFRHLCGPTEGIALQHCTVTDDGACCAIECNCVGWAGTSIPPQAGVAVYERGPSSKLAAARIHDDVDPPLAR